MSPVGNKALKSILRDERGNVAMIFGLMLIPMCGLVGGAVDYSRANRVKTELQSAVDAAAIAGLRAQGTTTQRIAVATASFKANYYPSVASNDPSASLTPQVTIAGDTVTVVATQNVETMFLSVIGTDFNAVSAESVVEKSGGHKVEVAMMVDLTGSMGATRNGTTKIAALKLAGADLLDILFPTGNSDLVKVGIAPMADYVNAGPYAAAATGLPANGAYNNISNLASTKQGPFSGAYSGVGNNGAGSGNQHGATSQSSAQAGSTFTNSYCSTPTTTTNTPRTHTGRINHTNYTWAVASYWSNHNYSGAQYGYFWVENYQYSGNWAYGQGYFTQAVTTATTTVPGCENSNTSNGPLVTCVTERTDATNRYTDASPLTGGRVGPFNQSASGSTNKLNYSSDGKCWTGGRELPKVIPLTGTKATLSSFFTNATIGGATPGHLGHAWAWYLLSPNWSSVWPADSQPAAYTNAGTKKYAIIMTDGEYNTQYSSVSSRTQALALCTNMKAQGIKVYTIGFGFDPAATPGSNTTDGMAKDLLKTCASDTSSYFFPYDSAALRSTFQNIGNSVMSGDTAETVKLTQ